jgi:hypothetical protein
MDRTHPGRWAPLQPPAGLGDLAELDGPWAHAAHHAAVAVLAGAVGDAYAWTPWGYPPPGAYRGHVAPVVPARRPRVRPAPAPTPAAVTEAFRRPGPTTPHRVPTIPATPLLPGRA